MEKVFESSFRRWGKNFVRTHIFKVENQDKWDEYMGMIDAELYEVCGLADRSTILLMNGEKFRSYSIRFVEPNLIVTETAVF